MSQARIHYTGRDLTGMTFGKRGGPVYARVYQKSGEAADDALIRRAWHRAGYEAETHGEVWRVELELRSELLRTAATAGGHLPTDPGEILAFHLDELWSYLLTKWLVLRVAGLSSRIERSPAEDWWSGLADARGLNGEAHGPRRQLERRRRPPQDCTPLLRQAAGLLAAVGAADDCYSDMSSVLDRFACWMRETVGTTHFREAVERARKRQEAAQLGAGWAPSNPLPPMDPAVEAQRQGTLPVAGGGWNLTPWKSETERAP